MNAITISLGSRVDQLLLTKLFYILNLQTMDVNITYNRTNISHTVRTRMLQLALVHPLILFWKPNYVHWESRNMYSERWLMQISDSLKM